MKEKIVIAANRHAANQKDEECLKDLMNLMREALEKGYSMEEIQKWISSK